MTGERDTVLPALSGGPRLTEGTLADLASPSGEAVWPYLRALRYEPPGGASGARAEVFGSALEQAQQLFAAASVDYASRPILVFYGLSQAGRAIAACATAGGMSDWQLKGHGIKVSNLDQKPGCLTSLLSTTGKAASPNSPRYCTRARSPAAPRWERYG